MSKTMTVVLALVAGLAVGVPLGGQLISGGEGNGPDSGARGVRGGAWRGRSRRSFRSLRRGSGLAEGGAIVARPRGVDVRCRPRHLCGGARIACTCSRGVSCRTSTDHRPLSSPISDRACSFPSVVCHGAATRRPRFPVPVGRAVTLRADSSPGKTVSAAAYLASTRDGSTASSL